MKISASNIGWKKEYDPQMYKWMNEHGIDGLEIAPTRIFADVPYDHVKEAADWALSLYNEFGLKISSMQSIWYGRTESIFGSEEERNILLEYTKKAIDFAHAIRCKNLVFGCPRNRNMPDGANEETAVDFFITLGEYAYQNDTVLAMEANPPIYNTNFCNTTSDAINFIKRVGSKGFLLNLDVGTMIANAEKTDILKNTQDIAKMINHVHISEPGLEKIQRRQLHEDLMEFLKDMAYQRYISLEVKTQDSPKSAQDMLEYILKIA